MAGVPPSAAAPSVVPARGPFVCMRPSYRSVCGTRVEPTVVQCQADSLSAAIEGEVEPLAPGVCRSLSIEVRRNVRVERDCAQFRPRSRWAHATRRDGLTTSQASAPTA